jgi:hypothetical protein
MKISTIAASSFAAFFAIKSEAFKPDPSNLSNQQKNSDSARLTSRLNELRANGNNNTQGDLSDFLGNNHDPIAIEAFKDILNDDMDSLKKRLENGLNPDIRFFGGQTILHLIALKGEEKFLEDDKYLPLVKQLWLSGANLDAADNNGNTILDALGKNQGWGLGDSVNQLKKTEMDVSFNQEELNKHLAVLSLQKEPTRKGKQWAVTLIKGGADTESMTANGKRVIENIKANWSRENSKAFSNLVFTAKLKSAANKSEKLSTRTSIDNRWDSAVLAFYKAKGHEQKTGGPGMGM